MGFFLKPKSLNQGSAPQVQAKEENKDTAKIKARLIETEGGNKGSELQPQEGKSIRRVFG